MKQKATSGTKSKEQIICQFFMTECGCRWYRVGIFLFYLSRKESKDIRIPQGKMPQPASCGIWYRWTWKPTPRNISWKSVVGGSLRHLVKIQLCIRWKTEGLTQAQMHALLQFSPDLTEQRKEFEWLFLHTDYQQLQITKMKTSITSSVSNRGAKRIIHIIGSMFRVLVKTRLGYKEISYYLCRGHQQGHTVLITLPLRLFLDTTNLCSPVTF